MSLEQIAQKLKTARENSGFSLSQIHERTKIPFNHLEAMESGNFDDLPEPVYVSGFIKRYADYVGLDGQHLAEEYRNVLDGPSNNTPARSGIFSKRNKQIDPNQLPTAHYSRQPIEQGPPNLIKMIPFYAVWIILILVLIIYLVNRQESNDVAQQEPSILTLRQSATNSSTTQQNNLTSPTKTGEQINQANNEMVGQNQTDNGHVTLRAKNHVWVEVKANSTGEALFTGFLESGDSRDFYDKEGIHVRAGNGGNVSITAGGKTEDLGVLGKIAEKNFNNEIQTTQKTTPENTEPEKKTEVLTVTKKPAPVVHKPVQVTRPAITGRYSTEDNSESSNKSLDVPYRY